MCKLTIHYANGLKYTLKDVTNACVLDRGTRLYVEQENTVDGFIHKRTSLDIPTSHVRLALLREEGKDTVVHRSRKAQVKLMVA